MDHLCLLLPGLLGPMPELENYPHPIAECRPLSRWLARAEMTQAELSAEKPAQDLPRPMSPLPMPPLPRDHYFDQLAELLGVTQRCSLTEVSARADQCHELTQAAGQCWRADPVHFKADLDHALLIDSQPLQIQPDEAEALVEAFNRHFAEDGLRLTMSHPQRWYLSCEQSLSLSTTDLAAAVGRNVNHFLPQGADQLNWQRLLNEAQMLFHMHGVNSQRESSGQLTINSLWLWGERCNLPAESSMTADWLMTDEPLALGMNMALQQPRPVFSLDHGLTSGLASPMVKADNGVLILDQLMGPASYGDVEAWSQTLQAICEQWLEPLDRLLKQGRIKRLSLYTADGRVFSLSRGSLLKFWRKTRPLSHYINTQQRSEQDSPDHA